MSSFLLIWIAIPCRAQNQQGMNLDDLIQLALQNHPKIKQAQFQVNSSRSLQKSAFDPGPFNLNLMEGQYNSNYQDLSITLSQSFDFPSTTIRQLKLLKGQTKAAEISAEIIKKDLILKVSETWFTLSFLYERKKLLLAQDSILDRAKKVAELRNRSGESSLLEKLSIQSQFSKVENELRMTEHDIQSTLGSLQLLTGTSALPVVQMEALSKRSSLPEMNDLNGWKRSSLYTLSAQNVEVAKLSARLEKSRFMPSVNLGYFNQSLTGVQNLNGQDVYFSRSHRFFGYQAGLAFPLFFNARIAKYKSAEWVEKAASEDLSATSLELADMLQKSRNEVKKSFQTLEYYESSALSDATTAEKTASISWQKGEIGYLELSQIIQQSFSAREEFAAELLRYNLAVIKVNYLIQ